MTELERQANEALRDAAQLRHEAERPGATAETKEAYRRAYQRAVELTAAALRGRLWRRSA